MYGDQLSFVNNLQMSLRSFGYQYKGSVSMNSRVIRIPTINCKVVK